MALVTVVRACCGRLRKGVRVRKWRPMREGGGGEVVVMALVTTVDVVSACMQGPGCGGRHERAKEADARGWRWRASVHGTCRHRHHHRGCTSVYTALWWSTAN